MSRPLIDTVINLSQYPENPIFENALQQLKDNYTMKMFNEKPFSSGESKGMHVVALTVKDYEEYSHLSKLKFITLSLTPEQYNALKSAISKTGELESMIPTETDQEAVESLEKPFTFDDVMVKMQEWVDRNDFESDFFKAILSDFNQDQKPSELAGFSMDEAEKLNKLYSALESLFINVTDSPSDFNKIFIPEEYRTETYSNIKDALDNTDNKDNKDNNKQEINKLYKKWSSEVLGSTDSSLQTKLDSDILDKALLGSLTTSDLSNFTPLLIYKLLFIYCVAQLAREKLSPPSNKVLGEIRGISHYFDDKRSAKSKITAWSKQFEKNTAFREDQSVEDTALNNDSLNNLLAQRELTGYNVKFTSGKDLTESNTILSLDDLIKLDEESPGFIKEVLDNAPKNAIFLGDTIGKSRYILVETEEAPFYEKRTTILRNKYPSLHLNRTD